MTWFATTLGIIRVGAVSRRCVDAARRCSANVPPRSRRSVGWYLSTTRTTSTSLLSRRQIYNDGLPSTAEPPFGLFQRRQFNSFWPWRGGGNNDDDDDEDGFNSVENPQVSSFLLGGARKQEGNPQASPSSKSSSPSSSKLSSSVSTYPVSVCTAQGHRSYMEDEYYVSNDGDFAACFDGHGGPAVSRYLRKNLYANVQAYLGKQMGYGSDTESPSDTEATTETTRKPSPSSPSSPTPPSARSGTGPTPISSRQPTVDDYAFSLEYALDKCDREVERISHWSFQGSTAIVVWLHEVSTESDSRSSTAMEGQTLQRTILAANIGDSRAILCRNGTGWELSRDHKPNDPTERERIESRGGQVIWCGETDEYGQPIEERGIYRVNGNLALSRAVGDRSEKPAVTAEPEIISAPVIDGEDSFILLATDGLWDVMDSQEAVTFIQSRRHAKLSRKRIATQVVEEALRRGTYDNVTVVIIWLDGRQNKK
jgi:serine/threonine protein phosphatase PrpC